MTENIIELLLSTTIFISYDYYHATIILTYIFSKIIILQTIMSYRKYHLTKKIEFLYDRNLTYIYCGLINNPNDKRNIIAWM